MRGAAVVRGVTKERLDQLRITKYNRAERNPESPTQELSPASAENEDVCPICLVRFTSPYFWLQVSDILLCRLTLKTEKTFETCRANTFSTLPALMSG